LKFESTNHQQQGETTRHIGRMSNKRELVEREIVSSEERYAKDVATILDVFIRPLVRHSRRFGRNACVTEIEASVLECSLEKVSLVSRHILVQLRAQDSSSLSGNKPIGRVFMDEAEKMRRAYVDFVSGYRAALDLHSDLMTRKKKKGAPCSYSTLIRNCFEANASRVGGRTVQDFFILPIQRIPRYRLLLQELLRYVPVKSNERTLTKEALMRVCIIADEMNYRLRQTIEKPGESFRSRAQSTGSASGSIDEPPLDTIEEETEADTLSSGDNADLMKDLAEYTTEDTASEGEGSMPHSLKATSRTIGDDDANELHYLDEDDDPLEIHRSAKEQRLEEWLEARGWTEEDIYSAPTLNSFALYAMVAKGNPWKGLELSSLNAATLSERLLRLYTGLGKMKKKKQNDLIDNLSGAPPYRPQAGDIVVCGPMRSGQSPVIHALDCFRSGTFPSRNSNTVLDRVGFLQWETWENDQEPFSGTTGRILKSHQELKMAFGGVLSPALKYSRPEWKVVVTLRHPADVRISYFRHLRRMFRKLNPEVNFDRFASLDDFADVLPDYEQFIADVLKVSVDIESPQLLVLFYEELLIDPKRFTERIADFLGDFPRYPGQSADRPAMTGEEREVFIRKVSLNLTTSPLFIGYSSRKGSSNQGKSGFSKASLVKMDKEWDAKIKQNYPQFPSYEKLFCALTGRAAYPYADDESSASSTVVKTRSSSLAFFTRGSRREHATMTQNATTVTSMQEASVHGSNVNDREENSEDSETGFGASTRLHHKSGSFLGLGRLVKALSFSSSSGRLRGDSTLSSTYVDVEDVEEEEGDGDDSAETGKIDPDDSDEEVVEDYLAAWAQQGDWW